VYLTSSPKKKRLPTHVDVMARHKSTALCEQIHSISVKRLGNYMGHISDAEQELVNKALMVSLGLEKKGEQMKGLQIFNNEEFGQIRTVTIDNEPWFVGKDVAAALGYKNTRVALQDNVDDEDKGVTKVTTSGGDQDAVVINESGLYSLVFGSKLESAKRFKHWVTSEVLPSIRKTGSYQKPKTALEFLELQFQAIKEVDTKLDAVNQDLQTFKQDMPILGIEGDKITIAVRKKGVQCLGGKQTPAYRDKSLRGKVYSDIYSQIKREFGIATYKAIKRNQCDMAIGIIGEYKLPVVLKEQVDNCNNQMSIA